VLWSPGLRLEVLKEHLSSDRDDRPGVSRPLSGAPSFIGRRLTASAWLERRRAHDHAKLSGGPRYCHEQRARDRSGKRSGHRCAFLGAGGLENLKGFVR
jgi:hypothetical protein